MYNPNAIPPETSARQQPIPDTPVSNADSASKVERLSPQHELVWARANRAWSSACRSVQKPR